MKLIETRRVGKPHTSRHAPGRMAYVLGNTGVYRPSLRVEGANLKNYRYIFFYFRLVQGGGGRLLVNPFPVYTSAGQGLYVISAGQGFGRRRHGRGVHWYETI